MIPFLVVIAAGVIAGCLFGPVAAIAAVFITSAGLAVLQAALDANARHHEKDPPR